MIEEINSADSHLEDSMNFEQPPASSGSGMLPWVVVGICLLSLAGVALYGHHAVDAANTRAHAAEKASEDVNARLIKSEEDRKAAVRRATELAEKGDEAASLSAQLKDKDASLTRLQQTQDTMVGKLRALAKSNKKVAKQIEALLPKPAATAGPAGKSKGKKHRG